MITTTIDGKMTIQLPEGFDVMDKAEVQKAFGLGYEDLWGARDEEHHAMLAFIWKDAPELLGNLLGTKALADRVEKALSKTYKTGGFHLDGHFDTQVAGREAKGFTYGFTIGDVAQQGEVIVFRNGGRTYTMYYYTCPECAEDNQQAHDDLLASLTL